MKQFPLWWTVDGVCACPEAGSCHSPGKHPLTRNGGKDATDDQNQLGIWLDEYPLAHWGVATGAVSGVVVIDLDRKPGKNGVAAFKALAAEHGGITRSYTVRTGSGGLHLYYAHPGGIRNSASKIAPGIDVRGDGGYVVAPPSGHASGGFYTVAIDAPIAPLPAWLLSLVTAQPAQLEPLAPRGFFPPASPAVLEAAAAQLEQHGPAIEGDGGDMHTFVACALLIHDYALTEDEAWPLLVEWNATCEPSWGDHALAAKMRGAGKYATGAYGKRRSADAVETARKLITDWQADPSEAAQWPMIDRVRELAAASGDPAKRATIERDLMAATGLSARAVSLPKHTVEIDHPKGSIIVGVEIHKTADESIEAIADHVFARNGVLCEIAKNEGTRIEDLETARIQDLMSRHATYVRADPEKGSVTCVAPERVAALLHARRSHPVRVLQAVTTAPIFLADGSILQARGYNEAARVFLEPSVTVDVPCDPTLEHARASVAILKDLLSDFVFATPADFSSWLAGLLSPLVKAATGNAPAPLICVSAPLAGSGKSLLTEVIARIITGDAAAISTYSNRDPTEWIKKLTAFVKAASPVRVLDNCNGALGDESLDRLITSSTWSDRILGASDAPPLPNVTTWFATGNNIEPEGDTVRRVLMVRLEVATDRPQERDDFAIADLPTYAMEHRSELLSAALTLLRAYHCAGRPVQALPSWGSFTAWSSLVRGAIVWAGLADPFLTQRRATQDLNEPENDAHDFWLGVVEESDGLSSSIVASAARKDAQTVLGLREQITAFGLRKFIGRFVDKPRAGKRIRRDVDTRRNQTRYYVEAIT